MQSGRYHSPGFAPSARLHVHSERARRLFPRSVAGLEPARQPLNLRRRKPLPPVVHDDIGLHGGALAERNDERRVGKEVRGRVSSVRGIPVVEAYERTFRQAWIRAHEPAQPAPRGKCAFARLGLAPHDLARFERAPAEFQRLAAGADIQQQFGPARRNTPRAHRARLHLHAYAESALAVGGENVPRNSTPVADNDPGIHGLHARAMPRQHLPAPSDRQVERDFRVLRPAVGGRHAYHGVRVHSRNHAVTGMNHPAHKQRRRRDDGTPLKIAFPISHNCSHNSHLILKTPDSLFRYTHYNKTADGNQ